MANKEIADLTAAGALDGTELVHIVQSTNSRESTTGAIAGLAAGKQTVAIPAVAWKPDETSPPESVTVEATTNKQHIVGFAFDAAADEYMHFAIPMPKGWDEGTFTFKVFWTTSATDADGVAWALQALAVGDGDPIDAAWGTAVVVTDDAQSAAYDRLITAESGAVTAAGAAAEGDLVYFRFFRDVSDANDDMTEDAIVEAVHIYLTTNAPTDA